MCIQLLMSGTVLTFLPVIHFFILLEMVVCTICLLYMLSNVLFSLAAIKSDVTAATTALSSLTLEEPGSDEEEEGTQAPQELPEYACRCVHVMCLCIPCTRLWDIVREGTIIVWRTSYMYMLFTPVDSWFVIMAW